MRLYLEVLKYNLQLYSTYPVKIFTNIASRGFSLFFLLLLWRLISDSQNSFSLENAFNYFLISEGITTLIMVHRLHWGKHLSKLIKDGQLSNYLIKPISLLPYTYADIVGVNFHKYFFGLAFLIVGLCTSDLITEPAKLLLLLAFIAIGITISYAINLFVAALSFYFTDTFVVQYVVQEAIKILSGALIPIFLFSETLQKILLALPFAQLAYIPASLTLGGDVVSDYGRYLVLGAVWSIILNILAYYFWQNSLHKHEAIGI